VPQTPLYIHTNTTEGPSAFSEAGKIIEKKYEGKQPPSGETAEDEKTLEQAASTVVAAAVNPEFDGIK